jgi:hypothetical protein
MSNRLSDQLAGAFGRRARCAVVRLKNKGEQICADLRRFAQIKADTTARSLTPCRIMNADLQTGEGLAAGECDGRVLEAGEVIFGKILDLAVISGIRR